MDTELARTFLTVVSSGKFSTAATRLFITQSTVSARIHSLEQQLGCQLFVRNKAGAELTVAGRWFQPHAATLVRTVERVHHEIGSVKGYGATVAIGGRTGLWDDFLLSALPAIRSSAPGVAIRIETGFEDMLMQGLIDGHLDIGVMYNPQDRPGLVVEELLVERLVYVCSSTRVPPQPPNEGYIYVDWGRKFAAQHAAAFPEFQDAAVAVNIAWLALKHIHTVGGSGYFPMRSVAAAVSAGDLFIPGIAPEFALPVYLVHAKNVAPTTQGVLSCIRATTSAIAEAQQH